MSFGKKSSPAPAPAPAPVATPTAPDTSAQPANRAAVTRAAANDGKANLIASDLGPADVDPLTQRKTLAGGSASLMG